MARCAVSVVGMLVASSLCCEAAAQPASAPDYVFGEPGAEAALTVGCVLSMAAYWLPQNTADWGPSAARPRDDDFSMASDFTGAGIGTGWQMVGSYGLEVGYYESRNTAEPYGRALRTSLIDLQAATLTFGLTYVIKRVTGRCRPRAWHDGRCGPDPEHDAFPSGHTSPVAAIAGSRLLLAARTDEFSPRRYVAFGFAEAASIVTAVLRVLAGAHSWEDVVAGWALGHATGSLVSLAHPMEQLPSEDDAATLGTSAALPAAGLVWSGSF